VRGKKKKKKKIASDMTHFYLNAGIHRKI
jgi:hypothetical protein